MKNYPIITVIIIIVAKKQSISVRGAPEMKGRIIGNMNMSIEMELIPCRLTNGIYSIPYRRKDIKVQSSERNKIKTNGNSLLSREVCLSNCK